MKQGYLQQYQLKVAEVRLDESKLDQIREETHHHGHTWKVEDTSIQSIQEHTQRPLRCCFRKWSCEAPFPIHQDF